MLKWLGGGSNNASGGNASNRSTLIGKVFHINEHHVVVEDIIAEGGFAVVFIVKSGNGQKLALKRLAVNNDTDLYLTRQEIAITKALSDCPHSVTYISSVTRQLSSDVHEVLILMQLYTGQSVVDLLNQRLTAGTRLSEREALHIFSDVCKAVARLHHRTKPIIHRDLKIENILHDPRSNSYILCDYGSCSVKNMHPEEMGATECSDEIARFTTLAYRSPEMVSVYSGKTITTKSDIWALGVMLYKLCFFETPFGEHPLAIVSGQFTIPPESPYSEDLHSLIGYLLNPDPDARPTIWQVCEAVCRLTKSSNHVPNVFRSPRPPFPLPSPHKTKVNKTTPATNPKKLFGQSNTSATVTPVNPTRPNPLAVTTTTISSRDRPRAGGQSARQPEGNSQSSRQPQKESAGNSLHPGFGHAHHKSVDSGLDAFGHVPFTHQRNRSEGQSNADSRRSKDDIQLGIHKTVDQFGSTPFDDGRSSTPPLPNTTATEVRRDLFGATPFMESNSVTVDQFGATPF